MPAESSTHELEPGFLEVIISLSDSIKYGEEENLNEFEYKPKEEVEIIGFKGKSDLGKGKESARERKEGHSTGIVPKSCSKHDRGKLPLSVSYNVKYVQYFGLVYLLILLKIQIEHTPKLDYRGKRNCEYSIKPTAFKPNTG